MREKGQERYVWHKFLNKILTFIPCKCIDSFFREDKKLNKSLNLETNLTKYI